MTQLASMGQSFYDATHKCTFHDHYVQLGADCLYSVPFLILTCINIRPPLSITSQTDLDVKCCEPPAILAS